MELPAFSNHVELDYFPHSMSDVYHQIAVSFDTTVMLLGNLGTLVVISLLCYLFSTLILLRNLRSLKQALVTFLITVCRDVFRRENVCAAFLVLHPFFVPLFSVITIQILFYFIICPIISWEADVLERLAYGDNGGGGFASISSYQPRGTGQDINISSPATVNKRDEDYLDDLEKARTKDHSTSKQSNNKFSRPKHRLLLPLTGNNNPNSPNNQSE